MKKHSPSTTRQVVPAGRTDAEPPTRAARRLDPSVTWSLGLYLVSFPLMLVWLVLIVQYAENAGVDLAASPTAQRVANLVYVVLVLSTLGAAGVIGLVGWRRRRRTAALVVAVLSALTAVAFVLFPALAG